MHRPENNILVIFGASGDLTVRKLIPALYKLYLTQLMPEKFAILGVSRTHYSNEKFREIMFGGIEKYSEGKIDLSQRENFLRHVFYHSMSSLQDGNYIELKSRLYEIDKQSDTGGNFIFYLSTPPGLYGIIPEQLGKAGLHGNATKTGWKRLIVEKPFGLDLPSAQQLNLNIQKYFKEEQIFRIDHYLGKETVQNIIAFRFSNGIFEPLWNRNYIHHIEITSAESIGVETRGGYYDESGALRDMVQNHLLQLLATITMEPPARFNARAVRDETVKVFQSLRPIDPHNIASQVIRGQYLTANLKGNQLAGYREEKNVSNTSRTETYIAMKVYLDNWRWGDVPIYLRTGKRLPTRVTEIVIHFRKTPQLLFTADTSCDITSNKLIVRIQPDEGILLRFGMKMPGAGFKIKNVDMDFHYSDLGDVRIASAYERLLLDCMLGDATLYARADAVEACWAFVDPVLTAWKKDHSLKLYGYPAGTWGPPESTSLLDHGADDWHYPCKNLTGDQNYCEL